MKYKHYKQREYNDMGNPKAIEGQGFHTNPERINREGRPRKYVSLLKEQGYKLSEINDSIQALMSMDEEELKSVSTNDKATVLEKTIAKAILKSMSNGSLYSLDTLLTRVYGKPKEQMDIKSDNKIEVIFVDGKTIL